MTLCLASLLVGLVCAPAMRASALPGTVRPPIYVYALDPNAKGPEAYDEVTTLVSLQGLINRAQPLLYVDNPGYGRPKYWLDRLVADGQWLHGREQVRVGTLDAVFALAKPKVKGAVIWDPEVPATVNVATTAAGVENAVVLSPAMADKFLRRWGLRVLRDFRGMFTGAETGSKKNDAYRWAVRQFIETGKCSPHWLSLFTDAVADRPAGQNAYNIVRDWAVMNRSFVFDLSPWGDEKPGDDPGQALGTDLATYEMILAATQKQARGRQMTELTGFFSFWKYANMPEHVSKHDPVPTEWQTVWLISPYNCYQNTATEFCYNQSFHRHAPRKPLKQPKPSATPAPKLRNTNYVAILMADYDSAYPLYHFLPKNWEDPKRGALPLSWGINPNLLETYPDIISSFYQTATPNDHFVADASCAGYINPNRVLPGNLPLLVSHNLRFYREADMSISGMVLDWDQPSPAVKDAFLKFSPGGFATIVDDMHERKGRHPDPHVWKGMPVVRLINHMDPNNTDYSVRVLHDMVQARKPDEPGFTYWRCVWVTPSQIQAVVDGFRAKYPDEEIELVSLPIFFTLFKQHYGGGAKP